MTESATLPLFYKESPTPFDTAFTSGGNVRWMGVAGDPVPYLMRNDDAITLMMLACFVMAVVSIAQSRQFIERQIKYFFRSRSNAATTVGETAAEVRFQCILLLQTCLLYSILQYLYTCEYISSTFVLGSPYQLIGIFFVAVCLFQLLRGALYTAVNNVFFDGKINLQWIKSLLFLAALEGVALYPVVLLLIYFNLSFDNAIVCFVIVFLFIKILTFYKCCTIFFGRLGNFLQIFLYFCALELIPLVSLWGILVIIGNYLKVNF